MIGFEPGRAIEQRLTQDGALAWTEDVRFHVEDVGAGARSRFVVTARVNYTTTLGTIMAPLIAIVAQQKLDGDLARLKSLAEAK